MPLAGEREARPDARARLHGHPAVGGLAQQPLPGGTRERQAQGAGLDLELKIARRDSDGLALDDVEGRRCPGPWADERRRGRWAERDPDDARAADRDLDRARRLGKVEAGDGPPQPVGAPPITAPPPPACGGAPTTPPPPP